MSGAALLMAVLLAASACSSSGTSAEVAEQAEAEYREGVALRHTADRARPHFQAAAACFEELRRRGARNAQLYRNLGNAYLLAGELPQAILAYRRGLDLAPWDTDLRQGLHEARAHVAYPRSSTLGQPPPESSASWLPAAPIRWLFLLAAGLYTLAWMTVTRWRMKRRRRLLSVSLAAFLAAVLASVLLAMMLHWQEQHAQHPLVVIAEDGVLLRKGNSRAFPPRYDTPLPRGVEGRLLFSREGWVQIELAGGEVGWLPREQALVDEP